MTMLDTPPGKSNVSQHLIEVHGAEREVLAGDHHENVAARDGGRHERDKPQQRILIVAGNADHAHRFVDRHRDSAHVCRGLSLL